MTKKMIKNNIFWLRQLIFQSILYIILYEFMRYTKLISFNLSTGITARFLFYIYIGLSILFYFLMFFIKRNKKRYIILFVLLYILISIKDFYFAPKITGSIWLIVSLSVTLSYYINSKINKQ